MPPISGCWRPPYSLPPGLQFQKYKARVGGRQPGRAPGDPRVFRGCGEEVVGSSRVWPKGPFSAAAAKRRAAGPHGSALETRIVQAGKKPSSFKARAKPSCGGRPRSFCGGGGGKPAEPPHIAAIACLQGAGYPAGKCDGSGIRRARAGQKQAAEPLSPQPSVPGSLHLPAGYPERAETDRCTRLGLSQCSRGWGGAIKRRVHGVGAPTADTFGQMIRTPHLMTCSQLSRSTRSSRFETRSGIGYSNARWGSFAQAAQLPRPWRRRGVGDRWRTKTSRDGG